jgi:hypothetical protein
MIIDNKFDLKQFVYIKTDIDQLKRIVTAIIVCPDNSYLYECTLGVSSSKHYDFELSTEPDMALKTA